MKDMWNNHGLFLYPKYGHILNIYPPLSMPYDIREILMPIPFYGNHKENNSDQRGPGIFRKDPTIYV
jgi:hypothetical protein